MYPPSPHLLACSGPCTCGYPTLASMASSSLVASVAHSTEQLLEPLAITEMTSSGAPTVTSRSLLRERKLCFRSRALSSKN